MPLKGDPRLIRERLEHRKGHFFDPGLLDSQFATLQEPSDALTVDIAGSPEALVNDVLNGLGLKHGAR